MMNTESIASIDLLLARCTGSVDQMKPVPHKNKNKHRNQKNPLDTHKSILCPDIRLKKKQTRTEKKISKQM